MSNHPRNEYQPDTVIPPGFHIQEKPDELEMTQADLAGRIGRTKKTVHEVITGKLPSNRRRLSSWSGCSASQPGSGTLCASTVVIVCCIMTTAEARLCPRTQARPSVPVSFTRSSVTAT